MRGHDGLPDPHDGGVSVTWLADAFGNVISDARKNDDAAETFDIVDVNSDSGVADVEPADVETDATDARADAVGNDAPLANMDVSS